MKVFITMAHKNTHTVNDIENLMFDYRERLQNAETKTEKLAITKKLKSLEQHWNSISDKHINGKKYPVRKSPPKVSKEELLKLIDSVQGSEFDVEKAKRDIKINRAIYGCSMASK